MFNDSMIAYSNVRFVKTEKTSGARGVFFVDTYRTCDGSGFDKNIAFKLADSHSIDECPISDTYKDTCYIYYSKLFA